MPHHTEPTDRNPFDPIVEEADHLLWEDMRTTYAVLDELEEQLGEAFGELTNVKSPGERDNIRNVLNQLDAVRRVRVMLQEIVDPGQVQGHEVLRRQLRAAIEVTDPRD